MGDKRPVTGTGGDRTGQKTQTLIFTYGRFMNADIGMCNGLHQIAEVVVEGKQLQSHINSLGLFHLQEKG